jgi:hypothetical protein
MDALSNLTYKEAVDALRDEPNFEALGDERYIHHSDMEARLYWAFCRPSGSHPDQISDVEPLVSIMAFNHSRLGALERFERLHPDVISDEELRVKIKNRTRMLFRALVDHDFSELNAVLELVPIFLHVAIDQLKNGRKWNDIEANLVEATRFIRTAEALLDEVAWEALFLKLKVIEESEVDELKAYLQYAIEHKKEIDIRLLTYIQNETLTWIEDSSLHLLQKKAMEKLALALI